jgi:hypothetical protein
VAKKLKSIIIIERWANAEKAVLIALALPIATKKQGSKFIEL